MFPIIAIYVVLDCLMDSLSMILLTIPIFLPIGMELGPNQSPALFFR
jgi:TRAP-type C4-dicarboxylate transport system permease large subunit